MFYKYLEAWLLQLHELQEEKVVLNTDIDLYIYNSRIQIAILLAIVELLRATTFLSIKEVISTLQTHKIPLSPITEKMLKETIININNSR